MIELLSFLVKAKINTYASSGKGGERIISDGSKEFGFKEEELNTGIDILVIILSIHWPRHCLGK